MGTRARLSVSLQSEAMHQTFILQSRRQGEEPRHLARTVIIRFRESRAEACDYRV